MHTSLWLLILAGVGCTGERCTWRYRRHPGDCEAFLVCDFGNEIVQRCPRGLHWNQRVLACDWRHIAKCDVESNLVDIGESVPLSDPTDKEQRCSESLQAHPTDCSKFYMCDHGNLVEMSCTEPLLWNDKHKVCDWPQNVECQGGPNPPPTTEAVSTPSTSTSTIGPPAPPPDEEDGPAPIVGPPAPPPPEEPITTPKPTTTSHRPKPPTTRPPTTTHPGTTDATFIPVILGPTPSADDVHSEPDYKIICYFTDWSWYRPGDGKYGPKDVNPDLCTHYVYAFALLDSNNWAMKPADTWLDLDNKFYKQMTELRKKGKKVTIALGGWNDSGGQKYSLMLRDPSKIQTFINSVAEFIKEHDFDGVDLDYEYPGCPQGECRPDYAHDKNGFSILIKGLREALPPGSVISAAVSANKEIIEHAYDVRTLSSTLDWIGIMDYDIHGAWEKQTGHIAPLYFHPEDTKEHLNVNYSINYWMAMGAEPSKLVMGVPLYGQAFTLKDPNDHSLFAPVQGPGKPGPYSRQGGILSYYEICSSSWSKRIIDPEGRMGPYLIEGDQWVSYDDEHFITQKMSYVKQMGMGGAMAWALDFDDFRNLCGDGPYPLIRAMKRVLNSKSNDEDEDKDPDPSDPHEE